MNSHSYFWRHPDQLADLRKQLAAIPMGEGKLRAWCAGCAHGQEAFSVAALLLSLGRDFEIVATDICADNIALARKGIFPVRDSEVLPDSVRRVIQETEGGFKLRNEVLQRIDFKVDDLRASRVHGPFDLILCRNVLIYFTLGESQSALKFFSELLSPKGLLVLGYAEAALADSSKFCSTGRHATYRLPPTPASVPAHLPPIEENSTSSLLLAKKAFAAGQLREAKQLFQETLEWDPVPQISYYFLTLLAIDLNELSGLRERLRQLKEDLDFSDAISIQTLAAHGITPARFQRTLTRLFEKYEVPS